jgi:uridine phosphorylase
MAGDLLPADYPILEYDAAEEAVIEPRRVIAPIDIAEHCVVCFFQDVLDALVDAGQLTRVACQRSEMGEHPVFELASEGRRVAVFQPGVGAALAAGLLEEVIALGCKKFVACGSAGSLDGRITMGQIVVPVAAVRDEGTSYHYLPPGREVRASPEGVAAIEAVLKQHGIEYVPGKTWTTDAVYRETPAKVRMRKAEGCVTVEMEAAALFAVAQFRRVVLAQLLYGGDDLSGSEWDSRGYTKAASVREKLFWLAVEACLRL